MKPDWKETASPPSRNKIGVDDDTMSLVRELKQVTGVPIARIVRDSVKAYAPKLRKMSPPPATAAAA
jgi:hypothetical protein